MEWRSMWNCGGKIERVCWIEKDVIFWVAGGSHLVFFQLKKKLQALWRCPGFFDGVSLICSYPQLHVIAFAESCVNPRLVVVTYPSMKIVSECVGGSENGYLVTALSTDYMIALGSFPDYHLVMWNWRTGSKLSSVVTGVNDLQGQVIRVSMGRPGLVAQLAKDSGRLLIWQVVGNFICSCEEVTLPKRAIPIDVNWSSDQADSSLAIADESGHVYIWSKNGELCRIVLSQRCATCLDYEVPVVSWFSDGILLKTTFCQIRFYRKGEDKWKRQWYIKTLLKPYIFSVDPFTKNRMIFFEDQGDLVEMSLLMGEVYPRVNKIYSYGSCFKFLSLVYPWGHHLAAADDSKNLVMMRSHDGEETGRLNLPVEGDVLNIISHLEYPMILISTSAGEICAVTALDSQNPRVLCKYQFEKIHLDLLRLSYCGRYTITGRKKYGSFYCIDSIEKTSSAIRKIETDHRALDIILFDKNGGLMILMLILPFKRAPVSNYIIIYKLLPHEENVGDIVSILKLPTVYENLQYGLEAMTIIASPFSSRNLHVYNIKNNQLCLITAVQSAHRIRGIKVQINRDWIVTYGFDGIVSVLKNSKTLQALSQVNSHHRIIFGVSKAVLEPKGHFLIALGSDGSLFGLKSSGTENNLESTIDFDKYLVNADEMNENILRDYSSLNPEVINILSQSYRMIPPEKSGAENWGDWVIQQRIMREEEKSRDIRSEIMREFNELKTKVSELLGENEKLPTEERLPISAFDLDMIEREQKIKAAKEEREDRRLELEFQCAQIERVANWIKETFWDVQGVKQQSIFAIFGETEVTNFPSEGQDPQEMEIIRWLETCSQIHDDLQDSDREPRAYAVFREKYSPVIEETKTLANLLEDEEEGDNGNIEEIEAAAGVTTFKFVQPSSDYCQFKHYTFIELSRMAIALINDAQGLKDYFNKLFNETFALKERAMATAGQIISHIRFINSELGIMFRSSVPEIPDEPQWSPKERPQSIITARDDEIPVRPYVSPSEQDLLDRQAEEQERLRLLMLSDDFRRKALIEMMDGVLEYRWEDIVKRDIPKPDFMATKSPDDYTKEEIALIHKYEQQVLDLEQEREKYKSFLETSYLKITKSLRETIDKFNVNLKGLLITRMRVESAVLQLELVRARWYFQVFDRMKIVDEMKKTEAAISEENIRIESILSSRRIMEEELVKLKSHRESLYSKDKGVTKFKSEFQSLGKIAVEALRKHYIKRPKVVLKNMSPGDVLTLAKCIASHNNSVPLLSDYKHYLASLDALDVQPQHLPESIQAHHWEHLVKIRRHQIDLEMKLKANLMEINEIEMTIAGSNGKIGRCKELIANFEDALREMRGKLVERIRDMDIQLVLKMGQVEMNVKGKRSDTDKGKLIPVDVIKKLNGGILEAGDVKLKALEEMMKFHRGTLLKEWEHKTLQMKIQELSEDLNEIKNILVTKHMRHLLKNHQIGGFTDGKTVQDLERDIAAMKKIMEKTVNDWLSKIDSVNMQIETQKRKNDECDGKIVVMNVDRWEMEIMRNLEAEERIRKMSEGLMEAVLLRSKLCRRVQSNYIDLLQLKTESQRLRMKRYPALDGCNVVPINNPDEE
nr:PREDICTED: cilia- and flagella-associated protein 43-like [Fopius arisanus]